MDDFGFPFMRGPGDRPPLPEAVGAHLPPHAPLPGLPAAAFGALLEDLGVDGVGEGLRLRGERRPGSGGAS